MRGRAILLTLLLLGGVLFAEDKPKAPPPAVTKAQLEARVKELTAAREQAIANLQALNGAIQDCEYWIAEVEKAEKEAAAEEEAKPKK
jgi:hypothetical protein